MILYIENSNKSRKRNLLQLIYNFSKVAGNKNEHTKISCASTYEQRSKKEFKKINPILSTPERIKYIGINSTKEVKDLSTENYNTLLK